MSVRFIETKCGTANTVSESARIRTHVLISLELLDLAVCRHILEFWLRVPVTPGTDVAPAINPQHKSSRRVRYLRVTVKDSNVCNTLLFHDFGNRVAREWLRRAFGTGSFKLKWLSDSSPATIFYALSAAISAS